MTNDTTTLNGALQELGETMADNLITMGVTDAQASDGLTTLANRILDVPVTPVTPTLTLTSNKLVLSYADSDTLTLTATLTGGTVSGQTIEFFNGSTSMGTAQTNSSGVATMTYSATGGGDVVFSATKNSLSSNSLTVEDCTFYDSFTSDNSRFTLVQGTASLEYSNTGLKYTGTATTDCIYQLNAELPNGEYTVECDVTALPSSGYSSGIGTEDAQILKGNTGLYARYISKSGDFFNNKSYTIPFHLKIEVTGSTSKTIKYYKDDVLMGTGSNVTQNKQLRLRSYSGRYITIKDLKIKPL